MIGVVKLMNTVWGCSEVVVREVQLLGGLLVSLDELNACLLVVTDSLLEEVGLALQRDHVHPLERVLHSVVLRNTQREQQPVCNELDVLAHKD